MNVKKQTYDFSIYCSCLYFNYLLIVYIFQIKSNLSLYSLYYAEECNEFAGCASTKAGDEPISASLLPGNTAPIEMSQRWRSVGNIAFDLTARDLNPRPPAPGTNALPLEQLAGFLYF